MSESALDQQIIHTIRQVECLQSVEDCNEALADGGILLAVEFATSFAVPKFIVGYTDDQEDTHAT